MSRTRILQYRRFKKEWEGCTRCDLHKTRYKLVLHRGSIPAHILFIGEAPGDSEDVLGEPFLGPSGRYLSELCSAYQQEFPSVRYAVTNVVACYPGRTDGEYNKPTKLQCQTCAPRLYKYLDIISPRLIITLGRIPRTRFLLPENVLIPVKTLPHPSAIIRLPPNKLELEFRRHYHRIIGWIKTHVLADS